jgi:hypothetical protein
MINTRYKDQIIRYVLDSSNEENEHLAVLIARMRDEKRAYLKAKQEKCSIPVSGDVSWREEQGGTVSGLGSGVV